MVSRFCNNHISNIKNKIHLAENEHKNSFTTHNGKTALFELLCPLFPKIFCNFVQKVLAKNTSVYLPATFNDKAVINSSGLGNRPDPNRLSHLCLVSLFKEPIIIAFSISSLISLSLFPSLLAIFLIASLAALLLVRLFPFWWYNFLSIIFYK